MKTIVFLCMIAVASAVYTDIDESIDIDEIMADPAKLKPYMDCYLDKAPCTPSGDSYKKHIIGFLSNSCKDCDEKTKHIIEEFLLNAYVKYPEDVAALKAKYDPTGANLAGLAFEISKY